MHLRDHISLTWRYGKVVFLVGAIYNLVCALLQRGDFSYSFLVDAFILKVPLTAIIVYLVKQFRERDAVFFYINLGLSPRKLLTRVILADYLVFAILMTIMLLIHG
ncbi:MAG: hypothetical protein IKW89_07730 [Bacteroidales bacterium]|nr:hypothetical protein [Bacteroidales bacterium]